MRGFRGTDWLVLAIFLASCAGALPDVRTADPNDLIDGLSAEIDRAAEHLDTAAFVVEAACAAVSPDGPGTPCIYARGAVADARKAVADARSAIATVREDAERFWFAADAVSRALDAIANVVRHAGALS